ncbi:hypothetical protein HRbin15_01882 [bacterium HR15]|nr:hypothetical protein HRbin15_01882 [bacterium HR15]
MREIRQEPPARWVLIGTPIRPGIAMGIGAPLYLPTPGTPVWLDPRLFAQDEEERLAIEYKMPTEPVEVIALVQRLDDMPPLLAPYVRVVGWVVEQEPTPPLPSGPIVQVPRLPRILPPEPLTIIDGNAGVVYIEPSVQTLNRYQAQLLRMATHTRFYIETEHLPTRTWDGHELLIGAWVPQWEMVAEAVQYGADFVAVVNDNPPIDAVALTQALGGKPLWWIASADALGEESVLPSLWKWSVAIHLTCLLIQPSSRAPLQVEDWWRAMDTARDALKREHQPLGQLEVGLAIQWQQSRVKPPPDAKSPLVKTLCWFQIDLQQRPIVEALLAQQTWAIRQGKRRALVLNNVDPVNLATALGMQPHALLTIPKQVQHVKHRAALLGFDECHHWLLHRLQAWDDPNIVAQPNAWLMMRTG